MSSAVLKRTNYSAPWRSATTDTSSSSSTQFKRTQFKLCFSLFVQGAHLSSTLRLLPATMGFRVCSFFFSFPSGSGGGCYPEGVVNFQSTREDCFGCRSVARSVDSASKRRAALAQNSEPSCRRDLAESTEAAKHHRSTFQFRAPSPAVSLSGSTRFAFPTYVVRTYVRSPRMKVRVPRWKNRRVTSLMYVRSFVRTNSYSAFFSLDNRTGCDRFSWWPTSEVAGKQSSAGMTF